MQIPDSACYNYSATLSLFGSFLSFVIIKTWFFVLKCLNKNFASRIEVLLDLYLDSLQVLYLILILGMAGAIPQENVWMPHRWLSF